MNASMIQKAPVDELFEGLHRCFNRDLIDKFAIDFCYFNSKSIRKRLVHVCTSPLFDKFTMLDAFLCAQNSTGSNSLLCAISCISLASYE